MNILIIGGGFREHALAWKAGPGAAGAGFGEIGKRYAFA